MFRVDINGQVHCVTFKHNEKGTECFIYSGEHFDAQSVAVAYGAVRRYAKDAHNKVVGRKFALANALKGYDKATRTRVWDKYKQTSRII